HCTGNGGLQRISNVRKSRRGGVRSAKEHSTGGDTRITPCDQPIRARQLDLLSHTRVLWSSTVSVCRFRCSGATHRQQWREVDYGRHDYFCVRSDPCEFHGGPPGSIFKGSRWSFLFFFVAHFTPLPAPSPPPPLSA